LKTEACGQTVLPDRSFFIEKNLEGKDKIKDIQMRHFGIFQTMFI